MVATIPDVHQVDSRNQPLLVEIERLRQAINRGLFALLRDRK